MLVSKVPELHISFQLKFLTSLHVLYLVGSCTQTQFNTNRCKYRARSKRNVSVDKSFRIDAEQLQYFLTLLHAITIKNQNHKRIGITTFCLDVQCNNKPFVLFPIQLSPHHSRTSLLRHVLIFKMHLSLFILI